ncbi:hypothetical protein PYCCODRAFT_781819 [Trametes coccinea BRFM310]|uniref:Uncharacterized protein n=1 Tax=Trametes coccinea (strain BRFM310) TaxID=1353009 RepID=A0A1Y2J407_TRAC3|nr:hypothetical protein PYCCODRAFT_781819 [Trametes coccinea BRFM310]
MATTRRSVENIGARHHRRRHATRSPSEVSRLFRADLLAHIAAQPDPSTAFNSQGMRQRPGGALTTVAHCPWRFPGAVRSLDLDYDATEASVAELQGQHCIFCKATNGASVIIACPSSPSPGIRRSGVMPARSTGSTKTAISNYQAGRRAHVVQLHECQVMMHSDKPWFKWHAYRPPGTCWYPSGSRRNFDRSMSQTSRRKAHRRWSGYVPINSRKH